jgi:AcrR family transcriptional regulator
MNKNFTTDYTSVGNASLTPRGKQRPSRANGRATRLLMRSAAVDLIAEHGHAKVSLRMLAKHVGIHPGSLYNHISNKQEFLFVLLKGIMEDLIASVRVEVHRDMDAKQQLHSFVRAHIRFHTSRQKEVFIGNMELRNLEPEGYKVLVKLRAKYFEMLQEIVERGIVEGVFSASDASIAARGLLGMLNSVAVWFRPDGKFSADHLATFYTTMALGALGASPIESSKRKSVPAKR